MSKTRKIAITIVAIILWAVVALVVWGIQYLCSMFYAFMLWENMGKVWFLVAGMFVPLFPVASLLIDTWGEEVSEI